MVYLAACNKSRRRGGESEDFYMKVVKKGVGAAHFPTAAKAPDSRSFLRLFLSAPIPSFYALPPTLICTTIRPQSPPGLFPPSAMGSTSTLSWDAQLYGLRPPPLSPFSICLLRLCLPSFPPRETSVSPPPPPGGREKVAHKHQTLSIVEVFGVVERATENGAEWSLITQHSLLLLLVALLSFWPPCPPRAEALFSDFCSISSN